MKTSAHFRQKTINCILPIFLLIFSCFSLEANAQSTDQSDVLQKVIDLPSLQPYFLKKADGSYDRVSILQHPQVKITATPEITKFSKPVTFLQRGDVNAGTRSYFLFHELNITSAQASVVVDFYFFTGQTLNKVKTEVKMNKRDGEWQIVSSTVGKE